MLKKFFSIILIFSLVLTQSHIVYGQNLSLPTEMLTISPSYQPCVLTGIQLNQNNPFQMNFIVDVGDALLGEEELSLEIEKLIRYFLASLTIPEKDMWVNLSPYENNRIIEEHFGRTQMGRDLLSLDYVLKQLTSALMHPDSDLGQKFWNEIYRRSFEQYGTTDIPVDVFNKVWITPKHALIYEDSAQEANNLTAFIHQGALQVMLDSDYLASFEEKKDTLLGDEEPNAGMVQDVIRSVILPLLEKEVNEGQHFSALRQIYHSLLLATWLKKRLSTTEMKILSNGNIQTNPLSLMFMDQQKTQGIDIENPAKAKQDIYNQYLKAFQQGAYGFIKEEMDIYSQEMIPRKYFSGGAVLAAEKTTDYAQISQSILSTLKTGLLIAGVSLAFNTGNLANAAPEGNTQTSAIAVPTQTGPVQDNFSLTEETQKIIESAVMKIKRIDLKANTNTLKSRFKDTRVEVSQIFAEIDKLYQQNQSLKNVWATSQALKEDLLIICYLESSGSVKAGGVWQFQDAPKQDLKDRGAFFPIINSNNIKSSDARFAIANFEWLSSMVDSFHPGLKKEQKRLLVFAAYNRGRKGVYAPEDVITRTIQYLPRLTNMLQEKKPLTPPYSRGDNVGQSAWYLAKFIVAHQIHFSYKNATEFMKSSGKPSSYSNGEIYTTAFGIDTYLGYLRKGASHISQNLNTQEGHFLLLGSPFEDMIFPQKNGHNEKLVLS